MEQPALRVDDLPIGIPLPFNIVGEDGRVLYRAGYSLSASDVSLILERGLFSDHALPRVIPPPPSLLAPYDPEATNQVENSIAKATELIQDLVSQVEARAPVQILGLEEVMADLLEGIARDTGAALASSHSLQSEESHPADDILIRRSMQMSILSTAIASQLGFGKDDCHAVGLASMLHDLSLFTKCASRYQTELSYVDPHQHYLGHPHRSVELVSQIKDVTPLMRIVMSQVHEQIDGTGFPKGLRGHQLNQLSRIANLVDAYLCMLEPHPLRHAIVPADAIAYLVYHTVLGRFDRECVEAFLAVESIYPVGSRVELDDDRSAVVLRSSISEPLNPIVRLDTPSQDIIDLRNNHSTVKRPLTGGTNDQQRLARSMFSEILWTPPQINQVLIG